MLRSADFGRWWAALLFGLMLLLLLLIAAWLLRVFVPVSPTISLSAVQMPSSAPAVDVPDPLPVLKASLDEERGVEKKLKGELASVQDDLRKQLENCKPAGPALPAERWSKGDLATLKGCWVLGRDVPMTRTFDDGRREQVTSKAGRLCFDDQGSGVHEQVMVGRTGQWTCKAPVTAKFWSNGTLVANQPTVMCEGAPPTRWMATQLTCHRVSDEMASCAAVDKNGRGQVDFRRAP